jgi:predicted enzyme related to lactoylglutathione lyase
VLYRPSRQRPQPAQPGRLALCLRVERLEATQDQALALGAAGLEPVRQEPFGREVWLKDPEGNRLLLLETIPQ